MAKNKKKSANKKNSVIIIMIAALLVIFALFTVNNIYYNPDSKNIVEIPVFQTYIKSSNDNSNHHLVAEFHIEVSDKSKEKISVFTMHSSILKILQNTNYDSLKEKGGLDKLIKTMEEELEKLYPDIYINNIYVKNFLTDFSLPESSRNNSKDERIKMFQIN